MTPSPGPFGPTLRLVVPALVAAAVLGLSGGDGFGGAIELSSTDVATQVATQVAGISVERRPAAPTVLAADPGTVPAVVPAAAATPAPTTPAPTTVPAPSTTAAQDLRQRVLAQISFPWQERLPGWTVEFLPEREGYRGSTFPKERRIQIYLREGLTLADYVHVTAHELGHAVDVTLLDSSDHARWNVTRGRDADAEWWVASGADDFSSGAGDWAESFAWSQLPSGHFYSEVAPVPPDDQLAVLRDIVG